MAAYTRMVGYFTCLFPYEKPIYWFAHPYYTVHLLKQERNRPLQLELEMHVSLPFVEPPLTIPSGCRIGRPISILVKLQLLDSARQQRVCEMPT
jgi:hypothetical protein